MAASQEYIDFMLGNKATSKRRLSSSPAHDTPSGKPDRTSNVASPRALSSVRSIQKAYVLTLVEWIELDDQLYSIVLSISNLRDRIWHTSRLLNETSTYIASKIFSSWKQFGYRSELAFSSFGFRITTNDLDMAIDHSLLHHERMIRELRHRISAMNTLQEKLGRRYDELYRAASASELQSDALTSKSLSINTFQELFISTAKELYRKQTMVTQIIETAAVDSLLSRTEERATNSSTLFTCMEDPDRNPRQVAQKCCTQWPREHRESHVHMHVAQMKELQLQNNAK
jgi:hypothetical protein